jgi:hypothetical protein
MSNLDRWKNRRRMAWLAAISGLYFFPGLVLFTESDQIGAIAAPYYAFVMGIVMAYIGFASWEDVNNDKLKGGKDA